jgi:hypothetical protein
MSQRPGVQVLNVKKIAEAKLNEYTEEQEEKLRNAIETEMEDLRDNLSDEFPFVKQFDEYKVVEWLKANAAEDYDKMMNDLELVNGSYAVTNAMVATGQMGKYQKEELEEQTEDSYTPVAKGIEDETTAKDVAAKKKGQVIPDPEDNKKFAVIVKGNK